MASLQCLHDFDMKSTALVSIYLSSDYMMTGRYFVHFILTVVRLFVMSIGLTHLYLQVSAFIHFEIWLCCLKVNFSSVAYVYAFLFKIIFIESFNNNSKRKYKLNSEKERIKKNKMCKETKEKRNIKELTSHLPQNKYRKN